MGTQPTEQIAQQSAAGVIEPLAVLEREHDRSGGGDPGQQPDKRVEHRHRLAWLHRFGQRVGNR